ncbi:Zinc finger BED domain-containing protein 1 [Merluccius polli]|uniref:Zinc finger BED domain-containing protein 1 n=1 Tax=Merluccius polli TaxID=89951 RepID=A0AA47MT41_MERPO|nr:Zinc finger BED domain-containing protein 1 [Merluccius polli]
MVPFQTVERSRFKDMTKTLDLRYKPPSHKYFTETEMPKLYGQLRERVENDLRELKYYATTTDLWSSRTMAPYISLTIHYITDEWKLASRCLQTSYFPDDHTGEAIAEGLKDALESWGLREPRHWLITETPTRSGSRQQMIERVLEQEKAISQDIDVWESVNKPLSPLMEFTDALSGEEYVSVSYLRPVLHLLNNTVLAHSEDDTDLTKHMKMAILQYLNDKYSDPATTDLLDMASFADPRFKDSYIADDRKDYIKARATAEIQALLGMQAEYTAAAGGAVKREAKKVKRMWHTLQRNIFAFSTGGNIVTCHRSALKPETVDKLAFLANNL